MYKSSILIVALVSGVYASENPFAVEKNVQKIEQEESSLLEALSKEQQAMEADEDMLLEENTSVDKIIPKATPEARPVSPKEILVEQVNVEEKTKEIDKSAVEKVSPPTEIATKKAQIEEIKKEANESKAQEAAPLVQKESEQPKVEKKPKEIDKSAVEKVTPPVEKVVEKPKEEVKKEPVTTQTLEPVETQIEKIDAKIKELEKKLQASKDDILAVNGEAPPVAEAKPATNKTVEPQIKKDESDQRNSAFNQELQEAIKSVQD